MRGFIFETSDQNRGPETEIGRWDSVSQGSNADECGGSVILDIHIDIRTERFMLVLGYYGFEPLFVDATLIWDSPDVFRCKG